METRYFWSELRALFESEEWPSMEPKQNDEGTRHIIMIHCQLINVQSLSLWHGERPEEILRKM
jgi:hypothetical protein